MEQAVRVALRRHPALITAQGNLDRARGVTRSARGPFDVVFNAGLNHVHDVVHDVTLSDELATDRTTLDAGASTNLVWGTNLRATVGLTRTNPRPFTNNFAQQAITSFSVTQPLLKGAGKVGAASGVIAGEYSELSAEHTAAHAAQLQVFAVVAAYWDLVGAAAELALFQDAEARAQRMFSETQTLVEADQRPRGDLRALEAGLASRHREVIEAQRARVRSLHNLRLAMGLTLAEATDWSPTDPFPRPAIPAASPSQLVDRASAARRDLRAADAAVQAARAALRGADHNTLPRLDLTAAVGYAGTVGRDGVGRFFDALGRNVEGLNASGGVTLEVPLDNAAADGDRAQAAALQLLAETARDDLDRTLRSNVVAALDDLHAEVDSLAAAQRAEAAYAQALDDERSKLRAGLATVLDTVVIEDLLTSATRARIGTELGLALSLARLRLELGALPSSEATTAQAMVGVLDAGVFDGQ